MQELLRQLGQLFLQAIPTVVIVFLFYIFAKSVFFKPILHAMDERHRRIEGARAEAEKLQARNREKTREYEEALKHARVEIYTEQEASRQFVLDERARQLSAARAQAQQRVREEKTRIQADLVASRKLVEAQTNELAGEIVQTMLRPSGPNPAGAR